MTMSMIESVGCGIVRVLVVDAEPQFRHMVSRLLVAKGYVVNATGDSGDAAMLAQDCDVLVIDPVRVGNGAISEILSASPETQVVVVSADDAALSTASERAFSCLSKPADAQMLEQTVMHAAERRRLLVENRALADQLQAERSRLQKEVSATKRVLERRLSACPAFVGESEAILQTRRFIAEVAPADITVLIRGESGTGKDIVARMIHDWSGRSIHTFVKINCPAIPETLLESELFGHESGAFTGGDRRKPGRFEQAAGGTIFLDEIGEIPPSIQVKLLQVIEHKEFSRLGGGETIHLDTRIIGATNAALESMIAGGRFRTDLFYRLNEYAIELPPLRERVEDVPLLVEHFLQKYSAKFDREELEVSNETMSSLMRYAWPGNVRELESIVKRFVLTGREEAMLAGLGHPAGEQVADGPSGNGKAVSRLRNNEITTIAAALTEARWNQRRAAQILGVSYSALRRRIAKYDLKNHRAAPQESEVEFSA